MLISKLTFQQQQPSFQPGSPESTEYGFGVQFQQHQSQFYQMQHQPNSPQQNSHHLQYNHSNHPGQQILQSSSPHHQNRFSNQPHPQQMLQQPMHNMNLSDVNLPPSNSQHMLGNVIFLDNIVKHGRIIHRRYSYFVFMQVINLIFREWSQ